MLTDGAAVFGLILGLNDTELRQLSKVRSCPVQRGFSRSEDVQEVMEDISKFMQTLLSRIERSDVSEHTRAGSPSLPAWVATLP